jgi:hypothetical protein
MPTKWSLSGSYFETCNCNVACPCVFLSPPTEGECTVLVGWHIDKGNFDRTKLDGLNVALAVYSPGTMVAVKWKAALYFDNKASEEQKNALMQIFSGQAGGHPAVLVSFVGEVLGAKSAAIDFHADGKHCSLRIDDVAEAEIAALGGADVTVSGHPLAIAPGFPATVAKSKKVNFHDYDMRLEVSETNGFFSAFAYQGS